MTRLHDPACSTVILWLPIEMSRLIFKMTFAVGNNETCPAGSKPVGCEN